MRLEVGGTDWIGTDCVPSERPANLHLKGKGSGSITFNLWIGAAVDALDAVPTPLEVESDLKRIVHNLARWEALPLRALRALPSVHFWIPPPEKRGNFLGKPPLAVSNAAIRQRIEKTIGRVVLEEDWQALASIFTFDKLALDLTVRREEAVKYRKETVESFRKKNEDILLRVLAGEMYRWELEQALRQIQPLGQAGELDTIASVAAQ